jgi:stage II sporulation protein D
MIKNAPSCSQRRGPDGVSGRRSRALAGGGSLVVLVALVLLGMMLAPAAQAFAAQQGVSASQAVVSAAQGPAEDFVFVGRGNGHGMGLSQWGAWQGAREGNTFAQILAFYYPGTTLEPLANAEGTVVKVRVSGNPPTNNSTSFSQVDLRPTVSAATLNGETVPVGTLVTVVNSGAGVNVAVDGVDKGAFDYIDLEPGGAGASEGRIEITLKTTGGYVYSREYWGTMRVQEGDDPGELWVYNWVSLEKYVRSIAEVEYDWATVGGAYEAIEAVKAQAVAARTYAVAKGGATLSDNSADQCYRGYTFEAKYPGIAKAATDTAGLILTYQGQPITAYFSGHSGGYITNSAWSGTKPAYIVARADPWSLKAPSNDAGSAWSYTISADDLSDKVNGHLKDTSGDYVDVGPITSVEVIARDTVDPASHARTLRITGDNGTATVSVLSFRSLIGSSNLPSTLILTINGDAGDAGTTDPGYLGEGSEPLEAGEFYDVGPDHLYREEISRVVVAGLMSGYESGLFKPGGTVTRSQFAKIAISLHNATNPDDRIEVVNVTERPFDDVAVDSGTTGDASDWIAAAKKAGLVSGVTSDEYEPNAEIRRDQMATMVCRAMSWEDEAAKLSPDTQGFLDVPRGSAHWSAATYLKERGIIQGYTATLLGVEEPIMRQHLAVILCRVLDSAE